MVPPRFERGASRCQSLRSDHYRGNISVVRSTKLSHGTIIKARNGVYF